MSDKLRSRVIRIYKEFLFLGRDHPQPEGFKKQLKSAFQKNAALTDVEEIKRAIAFAIYEKKQLEAFYRFKKYRFIKKQYD